MGRRERPVDPADGPAERFAYQLRELRQESGGLTYRAMAARAHYSPAALAQAASGERLPTLPVALAYVGACGGDVDAWAERWRRASRELAERTAAADDPADAPYLGLARFEPGDRELFFGRERLVARLVALVRERRVVALVGPSGSGKSSLLRAGLVPALREEEAGPRRPTAIRLLTPGPHPVRSHAELLAPERTGRGVVLLVDQFEEVFTLCTDAAERARFVDLLLAAAEPDRGARVVLAVRADFFGHCAAHGPLAEAVRDTTQLVTPMSPDELRDAVVRPAAARGLVVERSLTARIVRELADEPGGLPLLSHALLETWRRRHGRTLAESAYDAAGGLHGALARTAEEFHAGLTPGQAAAARRVLLRLVAPGRGTQDTRRPADRAEFEGPDGPDGPDGSHGSDESGAVASDTAPVLEQLARARLVTLTGTAVELAHEALLTAWPRLRGWIEEDRERLHVQRRLTEAAHTWTSLGRDTGALYRGVRLAVAAQRFPARREGPDELTPIEREFLTASTAAQGRERRRRRVLTGVLCTVLVLALTAGLAAWQQNRVGERRRVEAEARRAAGVATSLRLSDPRTAIRLALAAWRLADLPETRSVLLGGLAQSELEAFSDPDDDPRTVRYLGSDGRTLTSVGPGRVTVRDLETGTVVRTLPGLGEDVDRVGWKRGDGDLVTFFPDGAADPATAGNLRGAGRVAVRDLTGRRPDRVLGRADAGAEMAPGGRQVIGYGRAPTAWVVTVWDAESGRSLLEVSEPRDPDLKVQVEYSGVTRIRQERERRPMNQSLPDATVDTAGRLLLLCAPGRPLRLWDLADQRQLPAPWAGEAPDPACHDERYRFVGDGLLAHLTEDGIRLWDVAAGSERPLLPVREVQTIGSSDDNGYLVAATDEDVVLWRLDSPDTPVGIYPVTGTTPGEAAVDPVAGRLRYLGYPGESAEHNVVHVYDIGEATHRQWRSEVLLSAEFAPDGRLLATLTAAEGTGTADLRIVDVASGARVAESGGLPCPLTPSPEAGVIRPTCGSALAFRADGGLLAAATTWTDGSSATRRILVWDPVRQREVASADGPIGGWGGLAFLPDGRLATTSDREPEGVTLWDPARLSVTAEVPDVKGPAFAVRPDGRLLVSSSGRVVDLPSMTADPRSRIPGAADDALGFSPDGRYFAEGKDAGRVVLWDGAVARRLGVLARTAGSEAGRVTALAFSPDGRMLAAASYDHTVQLWDLASLLPIGSPLPTAGGLVRDLAFSADSAVLYVSGVHVPLRRIEVAPPAVAAALCRRAGGGLGRAEWRTHLPGVPYRETC
ncbi:hypothetical protein ACFVFS_27745 [Kitasatospora sp. NPDC057692]|uniref:nSTAND1 domain-containing NTPase n=1 Tax=Kitasatospora sp. NPDC057692 TaxID=3346215 RepID=UPI003692B55A